ncbi:MAG: LPS translocon maturation chaperone LptM [Steroidobacteraceae bacterium]
MRGFVIKGLVMLCAVLVPLTMTAACGQKGPLYLPPRNGTVVTRPAGSNTNPPRGAAPADQPAATPQGTSPQTSAPQATPPQGTSPQASAPRATPPQGAPPQTTSPQTPGSASAGKKNNSDSSQTPK